MIKEVKKIIERTRSIWVDHLSLDEATLEICQLFEPELEPMEKLAIELKDCMYQGEPKPDEGRLLTHQEQSPFFETRRLCYGEVEINEVEWDIDSLCKAQDTKTASIVRDEWKQKCEDLIATRHIVTGKEKDAECQERVERIFREIEKVYGKTFGRKQQFIGVIPSENWQALKKKEGVK